MEAKVITCINEKGGVGKTSVCFNSAWELASAGKKILMIDMDGQKANLTFFSGVQRSDSMKTIVDVLKGGALLESVAVAVKENLDLIPANMAVAELGMDAKISRFRSELKVAKGKYDYIFVDVNPSPGWGHYLSLSVSDYAVVIMLPDIASLEGNAGILESIAEIQETTNTRLKIAGILFNRSNDRTNLGKQVQEVAERMAVGAGTKIFDTKIPQAVSLSECVAAHIGITEYDPGSRAAEAVKGFVTELEREVG
nr:ParA family protein [uncultured Lachnoclostridium sp.]